MAFRGLRAAGAEGGGVDLEDCCGFDCESSCSSLVVNGGGEDEISNAMVLMEDIFNGIAWNGGDVQVQFHNIFKLRGGTPE